MQRFELRALGIALAIAAAGCGEAPSSSLGQQASSAFVGNVVVNPTTDLLDGQEIQFSITGFPSEGYVQYMQCRANLVSLYDDCASFYLRNASAAGTYEDTYVVRRSFWATGGDFVSCEEPASCVFLVANQLEIPSSHLTPLSFRDVGPVVRPTPTLTVTPNTGLHSFKEVSGIVSGVPRLSNFGIEQCPAGATDSAQCQPLSATAAFEGDSIAYTTSVYNIVNPGQPTQFDCVGPEACMLRVREGSRPLASAPISFDPLPAPRRGTVAPPEPIDMDVNIMPVLSGAGWAAYSAIAARQCPAAHIDEASCTSPNPFVVYGTGDVPFFWVVEDVLPQTGTDCAATPGACVVEVYDVRDPEGTSVVTPLTIIRRAKRGVARIDNETPIVPDAPFRISGSEWAADHNLEFFLCTPSQSRCIGFTVFEPRSDSTFRARSDAQGNFRIYARLSLHEECAAPDAGCTVKVFDAAAPDLTAVEIPLTFTSADSIPVTSKYEPEFHSLLQQGMNISGWSAEELQYQGAMRAIYVLYVSGAQSGARLSPSGVHAYTTTHPRERYIGMANVAANFDYTVEEIQKLGALFWSWVIAGFPPAPPPFPSGN
ncbi:MAG TPA: hypothetical protein VI072_31855 [Polyangiaceae bacterium]